MNETRGDASGSSSRRSAASAPAPGQTEKFERLRTVLREMFQLDRGDLDFGLYRIMNLKRAEVERFLSEDLLPQAREILEEAKEVGRLEAEMELASGRRYAASMGLNPDRSTVLSDLRNEIAGRARQDDASEGNIYNHLAAFFERYYREGDFAAQRRYTSGNRSAYLVPYDGEEVKLHWANADQYYIRTTENYASYAFRVGDGPGRRRVRFEVAAAEGTRDDNQGANGRARRFVLARGGGAVAVEGEDLVVRFEHRPLTDGERRRFPGNGNGQQAKINEQTAARIRKEAPDEFLPALDRPEPTEAFPERTTLGRHLAAYTAKNSFDYFIHKDLGGFLRSELDLYLKNEVLNLDDLDLRDGGRLRRALARVQAVRLLGEKIIAFLAQLEDFQKRLWLKKKFVLETRYCVTLDRVPEALYPEIAGNEAQRDEWERLYTISEIAPDLLNGGGGGSGDLSEDFLRSNPFLVLDTRHFDQDFEDRLLAALSEAAPLDEQQDGLLIHGENFQALTLLRARYAGQVKCIYIDPPYNTGGGDFVYKNAYRHSSWMAMIHDRLQLARELATEDSAIFASIDENEQPRLRAMLDLTWGVVNHVAEIIWAGGRKNDSRLISVSHEYIHVYVRDHAGLVRRGVEWRQRKRGLEDIYRQYRRLRRENGDDHAAMTRGLKDWYAGLADSHPAKDHRHYCQVDARGIYFPDNISWPGGGGPAYEVLHPVTGKPVAVPSRGWMTSDPDKMRQWIEDDRIHFGADESSVPNIKSYLRDREYQTPYSVIYKDGRGATKRLRDILGTDDFGYPKDETIIGDCVGMLTGNGDVVADFFAGSGTTGHALIRLNRSDEARRRYVLVEMAEHFDTVLLPRLKKVVHSPDWKDGKPVSRKGISQFFRYLRLESYEDTMDSLTVEPRNEGELGLHPDLVEDYRLRYALEVETNGSPCLLRSDFEDPFGYTLSVVRDGERRETPVDLPETFNLLLGLRESRRRRIEGVLAIEGENAGGERCLVLWRDRRRTDNHAFDAWFRAHRDEFAPFERVYANGDHTLNALAGADDSWLATTIEPAFRRLMFEED